MLFSKKSFFKIFTATLALAFTVPLSDQAFSQSIITDGRTVTTLSTSGNTTNITTTTTRDGNAFNSFSKFNVDSGKTVNLVIPTSSNNLINIVTGSRSNIDGVLNSVKGGKIGGNVFLLNPYGIAVGSAGKVNVGSLTAITPTKSFVDNFFISPGNPNPSSVSAVLSGSAPVNTSAAITNNGIIRANDSITLSTGSIVNNGFICSNINDIVNTNGRNITLQADKITIAKGSISAPHNKVIISRQTAGDIEILNTKSASSPKLELTPFELSRIHTDQLVLGNSDSTNGNTQNITSRVNLTITPSLQAKAENLQFRNITSKGSIELLGGSGEFGSLIAGNLKAGKNVRLTDIGSIQTGDINAGNDISTISEVGDFVGGKLVAGHDVTIEQFSKIKDISAGGSVSLQNILREGTAGNINAKENISLGASEGFITTGKLTAGLDVGLFDADNSGISTGNIVAKRDVLATAVSDSSIGTGNINAKRNINLSGPSGSIGIGNLYAGNSINVDAGQLHAGNISAGDSISLGDNVNAKNIVAGGSIQAGSLKALDVKAGESIFFSTTSEQSPNYYIRNAKAGKDVTIFTLSGSIKTGDVTAGGGVDLNSSGGNISTGNIKANDNVGLLAADNFTSGSISSKNGGVGIAASKTIKTGNISAADTIFLGSIFADGLTTITRDIQVGNLSAGDNIDFLASNTITTGNIDTKGSLTASNRDLNDFGKLTKANKINMKNITVRKNVTLSAHKVYTGAIKAGGKVVIIKDK